MLLVELWMLLCRTPAEFCFINFLPWRSLKVVTESPWGYFESYLTEPRKGGDLWCQHGDFWQYFDLSLFPSQIAFAETSTMALLGINHPFLCTLLTFFTSLEESASVSLLCEVSSQFLPGFFSTAVCLNDDVSVIAISGGSRISIEVALTHGGANHYLTNFIQELQKIKKFWPRGEVRPWLPPRSAIGDYQIIKESVTPFWTCAKTLPIGTGYIHWIRLLLIISVTVTQVLAP